MYRTAFVRTACVLAAATATLPFFANAQAVANLDLRATIEAQLRSDPRTAEVPQDQIDSIVDALTVEATKQGLTPSDITWRPAGSENTFTSDERASDASCGRIPAPLCALNRALGFDGSDSAILVGFGILCALVVLIIGLIFEAHRREGVRTPPTVPPAPQIP